MTTTLQRIRRPKASTVEISPREAAILQALVFEGIVNVLMELNDYTRRNKNGTEWQMEARREHADLLNLQRKFSDIGA